MAGEEIPTAYQESDRTLGWRIVESCWRLYQADDRPVGDDGALVKTIAEDISAHPISVGTRCRELANEGVLVKLQGIDPETGTFKTTYAPRYLIERDPDAPPVPGLVTPSYLPNSGHGGGD